MTQAPFVLLLPRTLAPGEYKLAAILYDPNTLERDRIGNGREALEILTFTQP